MPERYGFTERHIALIGVAMTWVRVAEERVLAQIGCPHSWGMAQGFFFAALAVALIPARSGGPIKAVLSCGSLVILWGLMGGADTMFYSMAGALAMLLFLMADLLKRLRLRPGAGRFCLLFVSGAIAGVASGGALARALQGAFASVGIEFMLSPLLYSILLFVFDSMSVYRCKTEFGTYDVREDLSGYRVLRNGHVVHGGQIMDRARGVARPGSKYDAASPGTEFLVQFPSRRVAMVGLGTGSQCAYAAPGSFWTVYELDPEVVFLARTCFDFLNQSRARLDFVIGDAGKTLETAPDGEFELILLDVYVGGRIPPHMVGPDEFRLYRRKLAGGGSMLIHATSPAGVVRGEGIDGAVKAAGMESVAKKNPGRVRSSWIVAATDPAVLRRLRELGWT